MAIVPVAPFDAAKTRLGSALDAEERLDLVHAFLRRTLEATLAHADLAETLVISPDRAVLGLAAGAGARTLRQRTRGLNAGLREARDDAVAGGADAIIIVPIDLPRVTPAALDPLIDAIRQDGPTVALVTDRHGHGTNALALRPPDVIDPCFGPGSRAAHLEAGRRAGARIVELDGPLTLDVDTTEDLLLAEASAPDLILG